MSISSTFYKQLFCDCFLQLFSNYSLALLFLAQANGRKADRKMLVKLPKDVQLKDSIINDMYYHGLVFNICTEIG